MNPECLLIAPSPVQVLQLDQVQDQATELSVNIMKVTWDRQESIRDV